MRVLSALFVLALVAPASRAQAPAKPHGAAAAATRGARLLGTAFRTKGGAGEVVIQTSAEVEMEARDDGTTFVLKRCRIQRPNDRRPLDTRFFDSPVTSVSLKERGPDIQVSVSLRDPTAASSRKERGPGNTWYWILSFPRGTTAEKTPPHGAHATAANP